MGATLRVQANSSSYSHPPDLLAETEGYRERIRRSSGFPERCTLRQVPGNSSVSTFSTTARPARSRATCATCGAAVRQGPHQAAQKSTSTGTLLSRTTSSNCSGFTSMGSAVAASVALHAPHFPTSARCFAGIRFDFPQDGQFRMIAKTGLLHVALGRTGSGIGTTSLNRPGCVSPRC